MKVMIVTLRKFKEFFSGKAKREENLYGQRTDDAGTTATPTPSTEEATARSTIKDCVEQSGMFSRAR